MTKQLTEKYRPTVWDEVVGQDTIVRSMRTAVKKRTSRVFILMGGSGVGKTTLARVAANALNVKIPPQDEINAANFTGVDDMRAVIDTIAYRPIGGGDRCIILDECHMLSKGAWNALLKELEEPPAWLWVFLCTTEGDKIPATIKTRAITYKLDTVDVDDLIELLGEITTKEKLTIGKDDDATNKIINYCAKEAGGSVRQAISNLSACIDVASVKDAKRLLGALGKVEAALAVDLARMLVGGARWDDVRSLLNDLRKENAEGIRKVVQAYVTNVVLSPKNKSPERYLAILDNFSVPFSSNDGIAPVLLACGKLHFTSEE